MIVFSEFAFILSIYYSITGIPYWYTWYAYTLRIYINNS